VTWRLNRVVGEARARAGDHPSSPVQRAGESGAGRYMYGAQVLGGQDEQDKHVRWPWWSQRWRGRNIYVRPARGGEFINGNRPLLPSHGALGDADGLMLVTRDSGGLDVRVESWTRSASLERRPPDSSSLGVSVVVDEPTQPQHHYKPVLKAKKGHPYLYSLRIGPH
jgi:hypothetical protein